MEINISIPTTPQSKGRPRFSKWGTYTDKKTADYEALIKNEYIRLANGFNFGDEFIEIEINFGFLVPESYTKKKREQCLNGLLHPTKKDVDNLAKAVQDALNKVAYNDDRTIIKLVTTKQYDTVEYVNIIIKKYER